MASGGCEVDIEGGGGGGGGRGPHSNNVPDSIIELFIARRDLKRSLDSTSLVRNLLTDLLHTNF